MDQIFPDGQRKLEKLENSWLFILMRLVNFKEKCHGLMAYLELIKRVNRRRTL